MADDSVSNLNITSPPTSDTTNLLEHQQYKNEHMNVSHQSLDESYTLSLLMSLPPPPSSSTSIATSNDNNDINSNRTRNRYYNHPITSLQYHQTNSHIDIINNHFQLQQSQLDFERQKLYTELHFERQRLQLESERQQNIERKKLAQKELELQRKEIELERKELELLKMQSNSPTTPTSTNITALQSDLSQFTTITSTEHFSSPSLSSLSSTHNNDNQTTTNEQHSILLQHIIEDYQSLKYLLSQNTATQEILKSHYEAIISKQHQQVQLEGLEVRLTTQVKEIESKYKILADQHVQTHSTHVLQSLFTNRLNGFDSSKEFSYKFHNIPDLKQSCGIPSDNMTLEMLFYDRIINNHLPQHLKPIEAEIRSSKLYISSKSVLNGEWVQIQGEGGAVINMNDTMLYDWIKQGDDVVSFTGCIPSTTLEFVFCTGLSKFPDIIPPETITFDTHQPISNPFPPTYISPKSNPATIIKFHYVDVVPDLVEFDVIQYKIRIDDSTSSTYSPLYEVTNINDISLIVDDSFIFQLNPNDANITFSVDFINSIGVPVGQADIVPISHISPLIFTSYCYEYINTNIFQNYQRNDLCLNNNQCDGNTCTCNNNRLEADLCGADNCSLSKVNCEANNGIFSLTSCSCTCPIDLICPYGSYLNHNDCSCEQCTNICGNDGWFRTNTCQCECQLDTFFSPITNCNECNIQCQNGGRPNTKCSSCIPPSNSNWVGLQTEVCELQCYNNAIPNELCPACTCDSTNGFSGAKCNRCIIDDIYFPEILSSTTSTITIQLHISTIISSPSLVINNNLRFTISNSSYTSPLLLPTINNNFQTAITLTLPTPLLSNSTYTIALSYVKPGCTLSKTFSVILTTFDDNSNRNTQNICDECVSEHTTQCDSTSSNSKCECTDNFYGIHCEIPTKCQQQTNNQCGQNGFININENDQCDKSYTCYNNWLGDKCNRCGMNCLNNGITYINCNKCGCQRGYNGAQCQCHSAIASLRLNAMNDDLVMMNEYEQILQNDANMQYDPIYVQTQFNVNYLQHILSTDFAQQLPVSESSININMKLIINENYNIELLNNQYHTTFSIQITYQCDEHNPTMSKTDLDQLWKDFAGKIITLPNIIQHFTFDSNQPFITEQTEFEASEATLPSDDETLKPVNSSYLSTTTFYRLFLNIAIVIHMIILM